MTEFNQDILNRSQSYIIETNTRTIKNNYTSESDVNLPTNCKRRFIKHTNSDVYSSHVANYGDSGEYYKRYEHDEIPVRDESISCKDIDKINDTDTYSLTNSELEKLENKIYQNISQELHINISSVNSLESKIKIFKSTVQQILDKFYTYMQDFELYRKRYEDIISAKNRDDPVIEMKAFISDMIQHIVSSESCLSHESRNWIPDSDNNDKGDSCNTSSQSGKQIDKLLESLHSVVEAFKNESYLTNSTVNNKGSQSNNSNIKEETFNIFLLSGLPSVQIKMNERNLLSEINIRDKLFQNTEHHVASAENLNKLGKKKQELDKYVRKEHLQEKQAQDIEIPLKVSFAKKNIHLGEDFAQVPEKDDNKSLISKICGYICKKLRKF